MKCLKERFPVRQYPPCDNGFACCVCKHREWCNSSQPCPVGLDEE